MVVLITLENSVDVKQVCDVETARGLIQKRASELGHSLTRTSIDDANNEIYIGTSNASGQNTTTYIIRETGYVHLDTCVADGRLITETNCDPDFSGVDIEYISDFEDEDTNEFFRPRVLIEKPENDEFRAAIWQGIHEDYDMSIPLIADYYKGGE